MSVTGRVYNDVNSNDIYDVGVDMPLVNVKAEVTEVDFVNGFVGTSFTDANGIFVIDTTGMVSVVNRYQLKVYLGDEWNCVDIPDNVYIFFFGAGLTADFPNTYRCKRIVTSSWITKICFIPAFLGRDAQGVRVTFKDHKGKHFTCFYPGTTITDYNTLVAAASKGDWIHWFYDKKRAYVPWSPSI